MSYVWSIAWLLGWLAGCGGSEAGGTTARPGPAATPYEVHEWALLRQAPSDQIEVGTFAPRAQTGAGVDSMPMEVEKPVLYFHADERVEIERVHIETGSVEQWPTPQTTNEWLRLVLDPSIEECVPDVPGFHAALEQLCQGTPPGELCERRDLHRVVTRDATCITGEHGTAPFLFYRSRTSDFAPPFTIERFGDALRLRQRLAGHIPGGVVWMHREGSTVLARSFETSTEAVVLIAPPTATTTIDARAWVAATMSDLGMTADEIAAFVQAWDEPLFGASGSSKRMIVAEEVPQAPPMQNDSLLFFLPRADVDRLARVVYEPPPRAVHRAFAVWMGVP